MASNSGKAQVGVIHPRRAQKETAATPAAVTATEPIETADQGVISNFRGRYFFLSNFYECRMAYHSRTFSSSEAAFQSEKTFDEEKKNQFCQLSPSWAKHFGNQLVIRPDWETVKVQIMREVVTAKFQQNLPLLALLLSTKPNTLIEGNTWHDQFWGATLNKGKWVGANWLGRILMELRDNYKE